MKKKTDSAGFIRVESECIDSVDELRDIPGEDGNEEHRRRDANPGGPSGKNDECDAKDDFDNARCENYEIRV